MRESISSRAPGKEEKSLKERLMEESPKEELVKHDLPPISSAEIKNLSLDMQVKYAENDVADAYVRFREGIVEGPKGQQQLNEAKRELSRLKNLKGAN